MADGVQIPVVIDIDKAFEEAANKVPRAMKPLQEYMDENALSISLKIDEQNRLSVKEIISGIDNATLSAKELQKVMSDISDKIANRAKQGGFDLSSELKYSEKIMLQAYGALEAKINGVTDSSALMRKIYALNIDRVKTKIAELTAEYDKLTKQQNKNLKIVNGNLQPKGTGKLYEKTKAQLEATNAELIATKKNLASLGVELDKISSAGATASSSVASIKTPAMQMADEWRRGATYVDRYSASLKTANFHLGALIKGAASFIGLHWGLSFVRNIREVTAEFEMQRVALGGIIQDTEQAEKLFKQLKAAAIQSPFEIKDLVTYTKQLSAYRVETDKLFDVTMRLADVSAGLGVDMNRLILAYGQVRAASVLRGQELRQFTEAGIPLVELLADKFTKLNGRMVSTAEVFDLISKRAVSFSMIEEIFNDMTNAGGTFYKMQEIQSETLKGQWMKLKDALSIMYDEIGNTRPVHSAMEDLLSLSMRLMQNWRETAKSLGSIVAGLVAYRVALANARVAANALTLREAASIGALELNVVSRNRLATALLGETRAMKLHLKISNAYVRAKKREMLATNIFTQSLYRMQAALLRNPYALAIAGVAALLGLIIKFANNSKQAAINVDALQKSIRNFGKSSEHADDINKLCDSYDLLSKKAKLSAEEEKKLNAATKELAKAYPSAVSRVNEHTKAIEIDTAAIRERNEAVREAIKLSFEEDVKNAEKQLRKYEDEYESLSKYLEKGTKFEFDSDFSIEEITLTEDDKARIGKRLIYLEGEIQKLGGTVEEAKSKLESIPTDIEGPMPTEFVGNNWKLRLASFKTSIGELGSSVRAFSDDAIRKFKGLDEALEETASLYQKHQKAFELYDKAYLAATSDEQRLQYKRLRDDEDALAKMFYSILEAFGALGLLNKATTTTRDNRLSQLKSDISELTNAYKKFQELRKYKGEQEALIDIGKMFPQLEGWTPTKDSLVKKLNEMLDKVKSDLARSPKSKTLLDMKRALETEISNLEFDDLKDKIETKLKNLQDEIKRSETARNFYHNILDLTGDEKLSASLTMEVYGQTGKEFKERVQDEMLGALESAKDLMGKDFFDKMTEDIKIFNVKEIRSQLQLLPETIRPVFERLLNEQEKFEADWYQNYYKVYAKSKDYSDRLADNEKKRAQALKEAKERGQDTAAVNAFYDKKAAEIQLEAMKDTYTWTKAFENLEGVSTYTLKNLIALIDEYIEKYAKDMEPQQLRELMRSKERAEAQLIERNTFEQLEDAMSDYVMAREKKAKLDKDSKEDAEAYARASDEEADALDRASRAMDKAVGYNNELASATKELLSAFASDKDASYYSEQIDNLTKSLAGAAQTAQGVMRLITSEGADPAAYVQTFTGVASFITGIVNAINAARIKKANDEIERQARALSDLEYAYGRLDKAIGDAFGNARIYNYNQQIEILKRKLDALNAQLDAERSKGNKASQDAINGYLDGIRETEAALADLQRLPAEFWAGQELTSASEAFVDSWIAAKKEFGDTASAIEETMQEMVENLVSRAAMSGVVQAVLKPWYKELNKIKSWDASTIARMVQEAYNKIPAINQGLEIAYSSLAAAGVDIRRTVGNLTGISRNYATASEESILGLTAATNTQNYYMSYMPTINDHVAAIRARLVGDGGGDTAAAPEGPTYQDQMLIYASNLPLMRSDTEAIRSMLERVIKPAGTTATHYVSVRM